MIWGIALGGALGALARYGFGAGLSALLGRSPSFPLATLFINVIGSFLLGLTLALFARGAIHEAWRHAFGTGFLGAFTTFSTFSAETDALLARGEAARAAAYVALSVGLGLGAAVLGRALGAAGGRA